VLVVVLAGALVVVVVGGLVVVAAGALVVEEAVVVSGTDVSAASSPLLQAEATTTRTRTGNHARRNRIVQPYARMRPM
jgi:hypothetical protein